MNKEELLQTLVSKVNSGEIRREEVHNLLFNVSGQGTQNNEGAGSKIPHITLTRMLYILGAIIVIVGVVIFVAQIWDDISSFVRIAITLGLGFLMAVLGSVLLKKQEVENRVGLIFHTIGGVLIPGGALVFLNELNLESLNWVHTVTFGIIFLFYLVLANIHKNSILTFFTIANGTAFVYLLADSLINSPIYLHFDLYAYLTMVLGVSYFLLAHAFRGSWNAPLISVLYFFGTAGILGAGFSRVFDSVPWQLLYVTILLGGLFLSAHLKSKIILVMSTIFLIAYVSYITGEYFADSLGWPISLVLLGFVFIGLGYASVTINKKYIAKN